MPEEQVLDFISNTLYIFRKKEVRSSPLLLNHFTLVHLVAILAVLSVRVELLLVPLHLFLLFNSIYIICIVHPAILSHLALMILIYLILQIGKFVIKRIIAFLLSSLPDVAHGQILLHSHHHVDHLLLQVEVFLLDIGEAPRILQLIRVDLPSILSLHILIVLPIVLYILALELLDDFFEIDAFVALR